MRWPLLSCVVTDEFLDVIGVKEMEPQNIVFSVYSYEKACTDESIKQVYYIDVLDRFGDEYTVNTTKITIEIPPAYYSAFNCTDGPWNKPTPVQSVPCSIYGVSPFQNDIIMIGQVSLVKINFTYSSVRFGGYSLIRISSEGCIKETNPVVLIVIAIVVTILVIVVIIVIVVCSYKKRKTLPKK